MPTALRPLRSLGQTGISVARIGYAIAPLGEEHVTRAHAVRCLHYALDRGIRYLDTVPGDGGARHVGEVIRTRRDEAFLATRVTQRSTLGVWTEIRESLDVLQTDYIDLVQIHAVNTWDDLEQILAPGGTVAALERARCEGVVRFLGITGPARPEILAHALMRYPFDTVLVALGMADRLVTSPETCLLPLAAERRVGVIATKTLGQGCFRSRDLALRYALDQPEVSLAIVGMETLEEIEQTVHLAADEGPSLAEYGGRREADWMACLDGRVIL